MIISGYQTLSEKQMGDFIMDVGQADNSCTIIKRKWSDIRCLLEWWCRKYTSNMQNLPKHLAKNSYLNLIKPLDLQKMQGLEEHVKWRHSNAIDKLTKQDFL